MRNVTVALVAVALLASVAQAGILPVNQDHKYEASLDGFTQAFLEDPDGSVAGGGGLTGDEWVRSKSFTNIDSPLKDQGEVPSKPYNFVAGFDALGPPYSNKNNLGVLASIITGLKVLAVDDYDLMSNSYTRSTGDAAVVAYLLGGTSGDGDIVYLGDANPAAGGDAGDPRVWFYHKHGVTESDFGAAGGASTWDAGSDATVDNDRFVDGSSGQTMGDDGASTLVIKAALQDISGYRVDGTSRAAPAGTLLANVIDNYAGRRPIFLMDVIGGDEAWAVQEDGMMVQMFPDANPATPEWDPAQPVWVVDDLISAIAAQPYVYQGTEVPGWFSLSDPTEWLAQIPEPSTFVVWSLLAALGICLRRRRRS